MTNRGIQNHVLCFFFPVIIPIVIPVIRSLIPISYYRDLSSKSRNCFLFLRKSACPESALRFLWTRHTGCCPLRDFSGGWWFLSLLDRILSHKPPWISLDILPRQRSRWYGQALRLWMDLIVFVTLQPLHRFYAHTKEIQVPFDCDYIDCVVELWLHQFVFFGIAMSNIHVDLVNYWRQDWLGIAQICWFRKALAIYRWESIDASESESWFGMVHLRVSIEENYRDEVFQIDLGTEVLVPLYLRFRIRSGHIGLPVTFCEKEFSHKLLHTKRNKEKSNMKLDNNGYSGPLASKATLWKASSNSLLLYFLLVYGTYICVCNNYVSMILYVFVITLLH